MPARKKPKRLGFGFCADESAHHFVVTIPASNRKDVLISEHFSYDEQDTSVSPSFGFRGAEGKLRSILPRAKWNAIADDVRTEFNKRLKKDGVKSGAWKTGSNEVSRLFGKELILLAWAIEEADPALIPVAIKNWLGLVPEERWWLYTMTSAATGDAIQGRNKGWRKAVRYALTENPVADVPHESLPLFELQPPEPPAVQTEKKKQPVRRTKKAANSNEAEP
jgi:Protein of unknown function (DUF3780)